MINDMKTLKKTTTKIVTTIETWKLAEKLYYVRTLKNGKLESNELVYKGKKLNGYQIYPVYNPDLSLLKKWNPFWGKNKEEDCDGSSVWGYLKELPEPQEIDIKKIVYTQPSTHRFYDINLEPIPVVVNGDYIEAQLSNEIYDLEKLKKHLDKHKNVVCCSDILEIPYYNRQIGKSRYLAVRVYPKKEWIKKLDKRNVEFGESIFPPSYDKTHPDFLNIRKFQRG